MALKRTLQQYMWTFIGKDIMLSIISLYRSTMEMWIMLQVYFESKLTIAAVLQGWGFQVSRTTFTPTFFTSRENEVFPQILCQIKVVEHTWLGNKVWYEINYRCTCLTTVFIKMARKRKCHRVLLTIVKIANGGAVLAAGGIIDLPCVPPGLRRDLFFCASTGAHLLTWRALGPKNIKKKKKKQKMKTRKDDERGFHHL